MHNQQHQQSQTRAASVATPAPDSETPVFDVAVIGGGPAGATAAHELARAGHSVLLIDREGRIKPCGGAVPPILLREFDVPEHLLEARVTSARMIAPSGKQVDMDIGGYVGMVDRATFDPWLRQRAAEAGAELCKAEFMGVERDAHSRPLVKVKRNDGLRQQFRVRAVIGADGANSKVTRECIPGVNRIPHVFAYHEIVQAPQAGGPEPEGFDPQRCDVYYQGRISPDFYGWVFPHGDKISIGTGTAKKGYSLKQATADLREAAGMQGNETVRCEGAPIPLRTLKRWDNGRDVVVTGDAAGAVAPSSGEGIYYAMYSGRQSALAVNEFLATGDARCLKKARKSFMKAHGRVFFILGLLQYFWYSTDMLRERFVKICEDPDVQKLTWEAYMNKKLVRKKPLAHIRIFFKDVAHLMGLAPR
jgi:geranylgeranyl reductase